MSTRKELMGTLETVESYYGPADIIQLKFRHAQSVEINSIYINIRTSQLFKVFTYQSYNGKITIERIKKGKINIQKNDYFILIGFVYNENCFNNEWMF
jgi:hypothetical protein